MMTHRNLTGRSRSAGPLTVLFVSFVIAGCHVNVSDSGTSQFASTAINSAPTAAADDFTYDPATTVNSLDVLANDSDPDAGDTLTIIAVSAADQGGTVAIDVAQNKLDYTPVTGFSGTETFIYTIRDVDGATDTATVTMSVVTPLAQCTSFVDGLVLYHPFEEGAGTTTADYSPTGNPATLKSTDPFGPVPSWVSLGGTYALQFDGVSQYTETPFHAAYNITTGLTLSAWVNPAHVPTAATPTPDWVGVVSKAQDGDYALWLGGPWAGAKNLVNFIINFGADGNLYVGFPSTDLPVNEWSHLVGTWDGADMKIYLNGVLKASRNVPFTPRHNVFGVIIGAEQTGATPNMFYQGLIDQVRIYDRPLCEPDIQILTSAGA